jgi:hypothetical protein
MKQYVGLDVSQKETAVCVVASASVSGAMVLAHPGNSLPSLISLRQAPSKVRFPQTMLMKVMRI